MFSLRDTTAKMGGRSHRCATLNEQPSYFVIMPGAELIRLETPIHLQPPLKNNNGQKRANFWF